MVGKKNYMRSQIFSKSTENTNAIKHQMEVVILHTPLLSSHTHYRYNEFKIHRKIQTTISLTSSSTEAIKLAEELKRVTPYFIKGCQILRGIFAKQ